MEWKLYLKRHPRLHLVPQHGSDALVEVLHDAHGELGFDAAATDQVVEGVGESDADAESVSVLEFLCPVEGSKRTMCCGRARSMAALVAPFCERGVQLTMAVERLAVSSTAGCERTRA